MVIPMKIDIVYHENEGIENIGGNFSKWNFKIFSKQYKRKGEKNGIF